MMNIAHVTAFIALGIVNAGGVLAGIRPVQMRCEYRVDPLGIDAVNPRLSWKLEADSGAARDQRQAAFQIIVASDEGALAADRGDLWDTGKVESSRSAHIVYAGKSLTSGMDCRWKVRVWDGDGAVSAWSLPCRWSMGLLSPADWTARWIGVKRPASNPDPTAGPNASYLPPLPFFRKAFTIDKPVSRATVHATALGGYVLHLNGKRVGEDYFNPGWSEFRRRVYHSTYDVTGMLRPDANALGAILSDGWYAGYIWASRQNYGQEPRLMVQLQLEFADGSRRTIGTDETWKWSYGPLLEGDIQQGETYDARLEMPGWDTPSFDDSKWKAPDAVLAPDSFQLKIQATPNVPVRRLREFRPIGVAEPRKDTFIFDLGQNIAGWVRLRARGPAGTKIQVRATGMLRPDGTLYTDFLRNARAADAFILKGTGAEETWEPSFTYHGFRYVEVTGYPGTPDLASVTGVACGSDIPVIGKFECSDPRVNQLYSNILWTLRGNLVDVPTGDADRDERLGWCAKGPLVPTWLYTLDMGAFLSKWMVDLVDSQSLSASKAAFLQVAPFWGDIESPGWSDDGIWVPYGLYKAYGDTGIIAKHYDAMAQYIEHVRSKLVDDVRPVPLGLAADPKFPGYGDWLSINYDAARHNDIINTILNGHSVKMMAEMAEAIGKKEDAERFRGLFERMKLAFGRKYVSEGGEIRDKTQTEYALALYCGFLDEEKRPLALRHLVEDIRTKEHQVTAWGDALGKNPIVPPGHLTTGFHGSRALLPVLSQNGRNDVAYELLFVDTYPSWLYPVKLGATTTWERWDSWTPEKGFQDPRMNSFHMPDLMASIAEWLFSCAAGIGQDGAGFRKIVIRPYVGEGLTHVKATYDSIAGEIAVRWEKKPDGSLAMQATVPVNTTGRIGVPTLGRDGVTVLEGDEVVWEKEAPRKLPRGISGAKAESGWIVFDVGSGSYRFTLKPAAPSAPSPGPKTGAAARPGGFTWFVGIVGNPSVPDIRWDDEELDQIEALGVNAVQLSIAWGHKPADEVLNLEDLDAGQRAKFAFRIAQAKKHGLRTLAHFGIPKLIRSGPLEPACILAPEVREKYRRLLTDFMTSFPEVDDVLVYTFDQGAWLCSEFGPCPRCSGLPLDERLPGFLDLLADTMQRCRPGSRLWWKPWELSKGQVVAILGKVKPEHLGLVLNPSTSNEVYPFNERAFKSDLGVKRLVRMAFERSIPVLGEFDHTLYKPLYQMEDFFPRLIWEQMNGWREMEGVVGVKEYYGFAPSTFSVNAAMLKAWMKSPEAPLDTLLREISEPYGPEAAPSMRQAWEYVAQSVEAYPWDVTYMIGPLGLDRGQDGSHGWQPASILNATWDTPIWKANRRANFMLTQDREAHPWLFEDAGLRLEDSAALAFKAVAAYDRAIGAGGPRTDDARTQRDVVWKTARSVRAKSLHLLETLAAQDARMARGDAERFRLVVARLDALLEKDAENQGSRPEIVQKLAEFRRDPGAWLTANLNPEGGEPPPRGYEAFYNATVEWKVWVPARKE